MTNTNVEKRKRERKPNSEQTTNDVTGTRIFCKNFSSNQTVRNKFMA